MDWPRYVRDRLHLSALDPAREASIVAELAQQLEQAAAAGRDPEREISDWPALARKIEREAAPAPARWVAASDLVRDLRHAFRTWRRAPGFTVVAILTLALGIGASTAMFSALNAVVLRPWLPSANAARLAYIWLPSPRLPQAPACEFGPSYGAYNLIRTHVPAFSQSTLYRQQAISVETASATVRLGSAQVRPSFFRLLGATAIAGRTFTQADMQPGAPPVALISQPLAQEAFGSPKAALGRTLALDGKVTRIIGVLPSSFIFPSSVEAPGGDPGFLRNGVWLPLRVTPKQAADMSSLAGGGYVLAQLRPDASLAQASAQVQALLPRINAAQPPQAATIFGRSLYAVVQPFVQVVLGSARRLVWLLLGAALLVLLIGCINVANLFLVRATERRREWSIRAALGAGQSRLLRQLLAEALLLALLAGALGLALAGAVLRLLLHFNPGDLARLATASLDPRVLLFALGASLITVLLFGLGPAWTVARSDLARTLQAGTRGAVGSPRRWRRALTVAEAALAVLLLAAAGLLLSSYNQLMAAPRGFAPRTRVASIQFNSSYQGFPMPKKLGAFYDLALERIRALPGVEAAALATDVPLNHATTASTLQIEGHPNAHNLIESHYVSNGYFRAMGVPLLRGHGFTRAGLRRTNLAVVSQAFASTYFRGHALGKRICVCVGPVPLKDWATIVGVAAGVRHFRLAQIPPPQVYLSLGTTSEAAAQVVLRSSLPPLVLDAELRGAIRAIDPTLAVGRMQSMAQLVAAASAPQRFRAAVFTAFGLLALLLAAIGIYAVLAYTVRLRRAEMAIRIALGAQRSAVLRLVLGEGMGAAAIGIVLGLAASLALTRMLRSLLYGVRPGNPSNLIVAASILAFVALGACALPAWRASRIDPLEALRQE